MTAGSSSPGGDAKVAPSRAVADELRRAHALVSGLGPTGYAGVDAHLERALIEIRLALLALGEDDPSEEDGERWASKI